MSTDVTNPGTVNVADQGDGLLSVDECVQVGPSYDAGAANPAAASGGGAGVATTTNPDCVDVANEAYGRGLPRNVFVG